MPGAPNYKKHRQKVHLNSTHHIKDDKEHAKWSKTLETNKYPKCVGKKLFEDCPEALDDVSNPPRTCKICSQYSPTKEERRERMRALMAEMSPK